MPYSKKIVEILILSLLLTFEQTIASETQPKTSTAKIGTLIIEFTGLNNNKGKVLAGLYNDLKTFPKENKALRNLKKTPKSNGQ